MLEVNPDTDIRTAAIITKKLLYSRFGKYRGIDKGIPLDIDGHRARISWE